MEESTVWWGQLEPWMDEDYVKQVCALMGWEPTNIFVPRSNTDGHANNAGYCILTLPSPAHAAAVMSHSATTMPNSTKPFVLNWATAMPQPAFRPPPQPSAPHPSPNYPKEYSIFVGDLAPEASNSDLVAVFRNPVLGLRSDREPKFIRPFHSCKSAKIMLDPLTGISRGYGFVRFSDEADQQRALVEMHGLYCLSRPMRISPATAKFRPPHPNNFPDSAKSVSTPVAASTSRPQAPSITSPYAPPPEKHYQPNEESWKHQAQARAILGNLLGPNGEQLSSTDPYNTTVFVGGLSPLISEDTLRTFFAPFGEIHYVKVPVGKHCGFVQFVRKADAVTAIEKMQGFPIGGSRIRLSWGRSQYKAAQAVAQAAQAAAHGAIPHHPHLRHYQQHHAPPPLNGLSQEQAMQLLSRLNGNSAPIDSTYTFVNGGINALSPPVTASLYAEENLRAALLSSTEDTISPIDPSPTSAASNYSSFQHPQRGAISSSTSAFSPFSPDPNFLGGKSIPRSTSLAEGYKENGLSPPKSYALNGNSPAGYSVATPPAPGQFANHPTSPTSTPVSAGRGKGSGGSPDSLQVNRAPMPISRPASTSISSGTAINGTSKEDLRGVADLSSSLGAMKIGM